MKQPSLKKNTIYNTIKSVSTIVFPLITFPYASRVLQADSIGKVTFGNSIVSYFSMIASLGLTTYAVRACSSVRQDKERLSQTASQLLSINLFTSMIAYALLALTLLFCRPLDDYRVLIILQSSAILFTTLGADWLNSAMEDFRYIALRTVFFQFLSLLLMFLLVKKPEDYLIYAMISVLSSSGAGIVNIFYRRRFCRIRFTAHLKLKEHLPPILLLFAMILSQNIFTHADVSMLGFIRNDYEVGLYSVAVKIYSIVSLTIASVSWVVMPRLSLHYAQNNYESISVLLRKALGFVLVLGLPSIAGLNVLADEIILVIGGEAYLPAAPVLRILTVALFFSLIGSTFIGSIILLSSKREKAYMIISCITAVANILLNAILIPPWGIYGAAIATALSTCLLFLLLLPHVESRIRLGNLWRLIGAPVLGSLLIVATGYFVRQLFTDLWPRTLITMVSSVVVYGITLLSCRYELIWGFLQSLPQKIKKPKKDR